MILKKAYDLIFPFLYKHIPYFSPIHYSPFPFQYIPLSLFALCLTVYALFPALFFYPSLFFLFTTYGASPPPFSWILSFPLLPLNLNSPSLFHLLLLTCIFYWKLIWKFSLCQFNTVKLDTLYRQQPYKLQNKPS